MPKSIEITDRDGMHWTLAETGERNRMYSIQLRRLCGAMFFTSTPMLTERTLYIDRGIIDLSESSAQKMKAFLENTHE